MQHITYDDVLTAARNRYLKGTLIAQSGAKVYNYIYRRYRCAVGAVFTSETLRELKRRKMYDGAITEGVVATSADDRPKIKALQLVHDQWMVSRDDSQFRNLIGV